MRIDNSVNGLIHIEKRLDANANNIKRITQENRNSNTKDQKDLDHQLPNDNTEHNSNNSDDSLTEELIEQEISIPLAYTANAKVISMQNANQKTLLDIKV